MHLQESTLTPRRSLTVHSVAVKNDASIAGGVAVAVRAALLVLQHRPSRHYAVWRPNSTLCVVPGEAHVVGPSGAGYDRCRWV